MWNCWIVRVNEWNDTVLHRWLFITINMLSQQLQWKSMKTHDHQCVSQLHRAGVWTHIDQLTGNLINWELQWHTWHLDLRHDCSAQSRWFKNYFNIEHQKPIIINVFLNDTGQILSAAHTNWRATSSTGNLKNTWHLSVDENEDCIITIAISNTEKPWAWMPLSVIQERGLNPHRPTHSQPDELTIGITHMEFQTHPWFYTWSGMISEVLQCTTLKRHHYDCFVNDAGWVLTHIQQLTANQMNSEFQWHTVKSVI